MKKSKSTVDEIEYLYPAFQGLAFWLSYKKEQYRGYHFHEGAICAELYTSINGKKKDNQIVMAEQKYSELPDYYDYFKKETDKKKKDSDEEKESGRKKSVDILLYQDNSDRNSKKKKKKIKKTNTKLFLFEVKRLESSEGFLGDLKRLALYKRNNPKARCFLVVCNQEKVKKFFIKKGHSIIKENVIKEKYVIKDYEKCIFNEEKKFFEIRKSNLLKVKYNEFIINSKQMNDSFIIKNENNQDEEFFYYYKVKKLFKSVKTNTISRNSSYVFLIEVSL